MSLKCKASSLLISAITLAYLAAATPASAQTERTITKLADGIYSIQHREGAGGNTTVVIGDRQVFVVETCLLPSAAREDIAPIRQRTDQPLNFDLNTHFHNDHHFGNHTHLDAFPALKIIAHD